MRLRMVDPDEEREKRRKLAINKGDEVSYEGVAYIVTEVGSKWVHMYRKADPQRRDMVSFKSQLSKAIPLPPEVVLDGVSGLPPKQ